MYVLLEHLAANSKTVKLNFLKVAQICPLVVDKQLPPLSPFWETDSLPPPSTTFLFLCFSCIFFSSSSSSSFISPCLQYLPVSSFSSASPVPSYSIPPSCSSSFFFISPFPPLLCHGITAIIDWTEKNKFLPYFLVFCFSCSFVSSSSSLSSISPHLLPDSQLLLFTPPLFFFLLLFLHFSFSSYWFFCFLIYIYFIAASCPSSLLLLVHLLVLSLSSSAVANGDEEMSVCVWSFQDNADEMISLDNDSFLNSLDSMSFTNTWTSDTSKHTNFWWWLPPLANFCPAPPTPPLPSCPPPHSRALTPLPPPPPSFFHQFKEWMHLFVLTTTKFPLVG